jgi:hypothetical protein
MDQVERSRRNRAALCVLAWLGVIVSAPLAITSTLTAMFVGPHLFAGVAFWMVLGAISLHFAVTLGRQDGPPNSV